MLLERGPQTAPDIASELGLSAAGVRRHLEALQEHGHLRHRAAARTRQQGRGRPAKEFLLTDAGRAQFGHADYDLAVAALRFVATESGEQAIEKFATQRVASLLGEHVDAPLAGDTTAQRAEALAAILTSRGYAASSRSVQAGGAQLCQHHCPVAHAAAEFPQLCEAETQIFADLLGTHVQRLATIARGDAVCTTHIPELSDPRSTLKSVRRNNPGGESA